MIKRSLKIGKLMNTKQARLYALPAGQGDCLLFQFENNDGVFRHILVDGGNRTKIEFNKLRKTILEILKEGENVLFCTPNNSEEWASAITKLLENSELRTTLKEGAKKTTEEFSPKNMVHQTATLLKTLV